MDDEIQLVAPQEAVPAFRTMLDDARRGTVLKPLLHAYLYEARFPTTYTVKFNASETIREPDGWFHPSTHPLWPERKLYYYLVADQIEIGPLEYMGALSVTVGKAMHSFVRMCLWDIGVLMTRRQLKAAGIPHDKDGEPRVSDEETGARGQTDGFLEIPGRSRENYEFKTGNHFQIDKIEDLDLDAFRDTWPPYYAAQQEYMRMAKLDLSIVLMMGMGYPWTLREFHVPFDPIFAGGVRDKYLRVRRAVKMDRVPDPCCGVGSAEASRCEARRMCPVGLTTNTMKAADATTVQFLERGSR